MKEILVHYKKSLLIKLYSIMFFIVGILPKKKKVIIFESYLGKQYSCNPRAIYEYLNGQKDKYDFEMVWSIDKRFEKEFKKWSLKYTIRFSLDWLMKMATAKYWITNSRLPVWLPKPKNTIYIQTWHGTPLKKIANDMDEVYMPGTTTEKYKKNFLEEASKWDYLISPNKYSTSIFKSAFQFDKEILEYGYPRNDFLVLKDNEAYKNKIKEKLKIDSGKKVILYAPTWRDNAFYEKGKYKFDLPFSVEELYAEFGKEVVILLRMHYLVSESFNLDNYEHFIKDVSKYDDIRELYMISDILITDYSSVFFDFALLKRPIIFYTFDLVNYRDMLRGFYFDIEKKAPGVLVYTIDQLRIELRKQLSLPELPENYNQFYDEFCYLEDGEATRKIVTKLFGEIS
ncbi:CDP-glycerol glycerophosphotransferase family protein [Bacillus mojavensis]|uniref:CDP-glycerol glycerophosphotransferase family protein n=1 Tax=Bacillus mojavensis TaxID=72360 RepID=UPI002DBDF182|nr:CDP-glycerol glycerophosphotransferase family protein [Bacillus mojavensis]MEC1611969.1 CDP-glycerol glycerophosphotransferase family protein [Bacillus mojavensis]MEC1691697.1 CDP-glycerol glycerophosphotransferase family protein [Bacillus mojavensis]